MAVTRQTSVARRVAQVLAVNIAMLLVLLVPVELVFGNWVRPLALKDLKRFSIPIGLMYSFDPSALYPSGEAHTATYTRDGWGLRGSARSLEAIDVMTVGGSTTDQRYLDDALTWQAVAEQESRAGGRALVFANAGVDGQSTVGHAFSLRYWFPLLPGLRPAVVLFYVGINDVLMGEDRDAYDRSVDATAWRNKSVVFQLYKVVRGNLRARDVGVMHGHHRPDPDAFTTVGRLNDAERADIAGEVTAQFLTRVDGLRRDTVAMGAAPVFVTQTAYGWNADRQPPRGMTGDVQTHGRTVNYADVAAVHQHLNRALLAHCADQHVACFDLAAEVVFDAADYYDPLHNTPSGAAKIGRYLAQQLAHQALLRPTTRGVYSRGEP